MPVFTRSFIISDIDNLELSNAGHFSDKDNVKLWENVYNQYCQTFLNSDNEIICIAGLIPASFGVFEAVLIPSVLLSKYKYTILKYFKNSLEKTINQVDVNRIHATVRKDYEQAVNTAKYLGFESEGLLRNYYKNFDYYIMSII